MVDLAYFRLRELIADFAVTGDVVMLASEETEEVIAEARAEAAELALGDDNDGELVEPYVSMLRRWRDASVPLSRSELAAELEGAGDLMLHLYEIGAGQNRLEQAVRYYRGAAARAAPIRPAGLLHRLSIALQHRHELTGSVSNANEAVGLAREAVELTPVDDESFLGCQGDLAGALHMRYLALGDSHDLDLAHRTQVDALTRLPPGDAREASMASTLAAITRTRFTRDRCPQELDEAVTLYRRAAEATKRDDANFPPRMARLGGALQHRFSLFAVRRDIDEAVNVYRDALRATPEGYPHRPSRVHDLFGALLTRRECTGSDDLAEAVTLAFSPDGTSSQRFTVNLAVVEGDPNADLEETISLGQALVAATALTHQAYYVRVGNLAYAHHLAWKRHHRSSDLDQAVDLSREAMQEIPLDDLQFSRSRMVLVESLLDRQAGTVEDHADLNEALATLRAMIPALPASDRNYAPAVNAFIRALIVELKRNQDSAVVAEGVAILAPMLRRGGVGDVQMRQWRLMLDQLYELWMAIGDFPAAQLDDAIELRRLMLEAARDTASKERDDRVDGYCEALRDRFVRTRSRADIDLEIGVRQKALEWHEPASAGWLRHAVTLASTLFTRSERFDTSDDICRAHQLQQMAVDATAEGDPDKGRRLHGLAVMQLELFDRSGDLDVLEAALASERAALEILSDDDEERIACLSWTSVILRSRYDSTGDVPSLQDAARVGREALALAARLGAGPRPDLLTNLTGILRSAYVESGEAADLDEAIRFGRMAVASSEVSDSDHPTRLSNLGAALRVRYELLREQDDIDESIALHRRAVETTGRTDRSRAISVQNLVNSLHTHPDQRSDDMDFAVEVLSEEIAKDPDRPLRAQLFATLSATLAARNRPGDLDRSVATAEHAIEISSSAGVVGWQPRGALAHALTLRYQSGHAEQDAERARQTWEALAEDETAPSEFRVRAFRGVGDLAAQRGEWKAAATAFSSVVETLSTSVWRGIGRNSRELLLKRWGTLTRDAVACAVNAGDPVGATAVCEQGRAVLLAQALKLRQPTPQTDSETVLMARRLADTLDRLDTVVPDNDHTGESGRVRERLSREWEQLLGEAAVQPGLEYLLRSPQAGELAAGASDGPVVLLNASTYGAHALVITRHGCDAIPLELTLDEVLEQGAQFLTAIGVVTEGTDDDNDVNRAHKQMTETLAWLWNFVTAPVLTFLGYHPVPSDRPNGATLPRIWWCPTGYFSFLPIHAAGRPASEHNRGAAVLDSVVSSYTPSVNLLRHLRSRPAEPRPQSALVVAMPETKGMAPLRAVAREAETTVAYLNDAELLVGSDATHGNVIAALSRNSRAHFACHAVEEPLDPSQSALVLYDRPLPVLELERHDFGHAELAFLSACGTTSGGLQMPDEALHLSAAFQLAGYRHVVGTLWRISDGVAAQCAADFYEYLTGASSDVGGSGIAIALHHAVRRIREEHPDTPVLWAAHAHSGP